MVRAMVSDVDAFIYQGVAALPEPREVRLSEVLDPRSLPSVLPVPGQAPRVLVVHEREAVPLASPAVVVGIPAAPLLDPKFVGGGGTCLAQFEFPG